jgi:cystathionine beta-lyase/cystathionine gamma-synthase
LTCAAAAASLAAPWGCRPVRPQVFQEHRAPVHFETKAIRLAHIPGSTHNPVITPLYLGTMFQFTGIGTNDGFDYSRSSNPTRTALERVLAGLEGGNHAVAYASGMAATDAVLAHLVPGDEVVAARNLYGGTLRLFDSMYRPRQVRFNYVEGRSLDEFAAAITPRTRLLWIETPTNPQLQIFDIRAMADLAHAHNIHLVVDNTFASPYFQQPLALGADIVLHSTTKYIAGHHDVIGGGVITNNPAIDEKLRFFQNTAGAVPSPFDCYLTLRGAKTLALRMRQHEANAFAIARFLKDHPFVENVIYPGLEDFPQHALAKSQMTGFGGMLSFDLKGGIPACAAFAKALTIFHFAESLGGTESLICHPTTMSHAVLTEEERLAAGITPRMMRLSTGIEHGDDLIADLARALDAAARA